MSDFKGGHFMSENFDVVLTASDNPNFIPLTSSDEIYLGQDVETCVTDAIYDLIQNKANLNHTHSEYAEQSDFELLEDVVNTKADLTHTHTEYASTSHTHSDYATVVALDTLETKVNGKANVNHNHTEYASISHTHDEYAPVSHTHTEYALSSHAHDDYASSSHIHSEYSVVGHDHDEDYSAISHTHSDYATTTALDEVSAVVSGKANASHNHDNVYYTETEVDAKLATKANASHTHDNVYDVSGAAANALTSANAYTDSKINALVGEGASTTLDTIGEISSAIEENQDMIDTLNAAIANKANVSDLTAHTGNTTIHVTSTERNNWDIAKVHADSAHAPSNAEANQNAFSNIVVGNTTIAADTKTDTLTLIAGNNVTLTANASGDSVTIASANTTYSLATQAASGLMSATDKGKLDSIAEGANNYTLPSAGTSLGGVKTGGDVTISSGVITVNDDSHNHIISNIDGLQSALDGKAASGHNHDSVYYTQAEVDTLLSGKAASSHTHSYAGSSSAGGAATSANKLNTNAGSATQPVYFANGVPVKTTYTLGASVPSGAKFTDTTYGVATTSAAGLMSKEDKAKLNGIASGANAYSLPAAGSSLGGVKSGGDVTISSGTITVNDDSHNHIISNVDGLQSALDNKAATSHSHTNYANVSHKHYAVGTSQTGLDLNNYTDAGVYTFTNASAPTNVPAGTNGWLVVMPWEEGSDTIKQLWFRHGTVGSNDFETYVRTRIGTNEWGSWSKYYTTSNPPTYAEVGASPAFTNTNGGVKYSYNTSSGKNLLDEINVMPQGVHTIYSQAGVAGNPKTTEAWRLLVHKTSATIGWITGFGSSGSIYTNYQNAAGSFTGWVCLHEATNSMILWSGTSYLTSTDGTPQTVTPSKPLSECRAGWMLLWSDYDPGSGANDTDFSTTFIPKFNPSGGTWGGKAFYCSIPTYVGGDASDVSTEIRVIKPVYVHDNKLVGSYQNTSGGRNDVVLRAVYEI